MLTGLVHGRKGVAKWLQWSSRLLVMPVTKTSMASPLLPLMITSVITYQGVDHPDMHGHDASTDLQKFVFPL